MTDLDQKAEPTVSDVVEELMRQVTSLHEKVDELLVDTRLARPFLEKYVNLQGKMQWMRPAKEKK